MVARTATDASPAPNEDTAAVADASPVEAHDAGVEIASGFVESTPGMNDFAQAGADDQQLDAEPDIDVDQFEPQAE
jgi:hypothetical protein